MAEKFEEQSPQLQSIECDIFFFFFFFFSVLLSPFFFCSCVTQPRPISAN